MSDATIHNLYYPYRTVWRGGEKDDVQIKFEALGGGGADHPTRQGFSGASKF